MAKVPNSVIGLDIGRHSLKSVLLHRRGKDRLAITHYGLHVPAEAPETAEALGRELKILFRDMGGAAKGCAVSLSSPEALIRIIEQPETPPAMLRDALRLNGMSLLNQDVKRFVLDCDLIPASSDPAPEPGAARRFKYLVGGAPRAEVEMASQAVAGSSIAIHGMQLAPVAALNAFQLAQPEVFANESFFVVDIGHATSTMMAGIRGELVLVRSIDFGGKGLLEALCGLTGDSREAVISALDQEDEVMVEYTRVSMNSFTREIASSIGFIEHHHDGSVSRIFVSGGPAKSRVFLKLMGEELGFPCESWAAADKCEMEIGPDRMADYERESLDLNVACGAALQALGAH